MDYSQRNAEMQAQFIFKDYGIRLNWKEFSALKHYIECFLEKKPLQVIPFIEGAHWFMIDYFDLDEIELRRYIRTYEDGGFVQKEFGLDFLGDEKFKEYCRRRVEMWRDERELI